MPDIPGDTSTTTSINVGSTANGSLEVAGDHDWFRITLTAGQSISVALAGAGTTPGLDTYLRIRDSAGNLIASNDDDPSGGLDSVLNFTAPASGTYYIDVGAYNDVYSGSYQLTVQPYTPPPPLPVFSYDQIANQLVNGYWGGASHHFDVTQGGSLTVNLTALTPEGRSLARAALSLWGDVIGITFREVSSGAQISFDDSDTGAYANASYSGGITSSAFVNVGIDWLNTYGTNLNSYSFQSYVHEIGHALGLGHAGNYNGNANYGTDALYQNDCWATTIMSYFDQQDNTYFNSRGFNYQFVLTPMNADIVAMSMLYGLSQTTRVGNTTYGFNSNAGRDVYNASLNPDVAYTVFDSGGVDTLNYSGYSANQVIDLRQQAFSNVGGNTGNVTIARGTVIENAIGGSGADTITGNSSNNVLTGNGGNDRLSGNEGNDTLIGGSGNDTLSGGDGNDTASYTGASAGVTVSLELTSSQNTVGAGADTLSQIENLSGSQYGDTLTGNALANRLVGGGGNDVLNGGGGNDTLDGGSGDDTLNGGAGIDIADYATAASAVTVRLASGAQNTLGAGTDTLTGIEGIRGSAFADRLTGNSSANSLLGNDGNDTLVGGGGNDTLEGGNGNDSLNGGAGDDVMLGGAGTDVADYSQATAAVSLNLGVTVAQNTGGAGLDRLSSVENVTGSAFNDTLIGDGAANVLRGGSGNDRIYGGAGKDTLVGGAGADNFVFGGTLNGSTNWDRITDFSVADDTIELSSTTFSAAGPVGVLASGRLRLGTDALDSDDRIIYDQATGKIYYDADGNGAGAKILFATVAAGTALARTDFRIVATAPANDGLESKSAPADHHWNWDAGFETPSAPESLNLMEHSYLFA